MLSFFNIYFGMEAAKTLYEPSRQLVIKYTYGYLDTGKGLKH